MFQRAFGESENAYEGNYEDGSSEEAPPPLQDVGPDDGACHDLVDTANDKALNEDEQLPLLVLQKRVRGISSLSPTFVQMHLKQTDK